MSDKTKKGQSEAGGSDTQSIEERRRQSGLRALIDEMLQQVRDLNRNAAAWDPEERARAEQQLEMIMARVRAEASHGQGKPGSAPAGEGKASGKGSSKG